MKEIKMKKVRYIGNDKSETITSTGVMADIMVVLGLFAVFFRINMFLGIVAPLLIVNTFYKTFEFLSCSFHFIRFKPVFDSKKNENIILSNYNKGNILYVSRKNKFLWQKVEKIEDNYLTILYDKVHKKDITSIVIFDKELKRVFYKNVFNNLIIDENSMVLESTRSIKKKLAVARLDKDFRKQLILGNQLLKIKLDLKRREEAYYNINLKNISTKKLLNIRNNIFYLSRWDMFLLTSEYPLQELCDIDVNKEIDRTIEQIN